MHNTSAYTHKNTDNIKAHAHTHTYTHTHTHTHTNTHTHTQAHTHTHFSDNALSGSDRLGLISPSIGISFLWKLCIES